MSKKNQTKTTKNSITTIKLEKATKERLDHLKEHEKESYEDIVKKSINILSICRTKPLLASKILRDIEANKKREKLLENPESLWRREKKPNPKYPINSITNNMIVNAQQIRRNLHPQVPIKTLALNSKLRPQVNLNKNMEK